ncbi:MAG: DUF2306 domain-containing protein [Alphaproteobacteria bacterium]|nr:DUF2306 domain-containing protein [Alphaproteobacteria bacterium]
MTLAPLLAASPAIQIHTAAALIAAVCALAVLSMRKGDRPHRLTGSVFAAAMLVTAISSFWIAEIRLGRFSPIHILSIITLISIPLGIWFRRLGLLRAHAAFMIRPAIGLIIAGAFAFLPGRIMFKTIAGV